jgi:hypothetical protein
LSLAIGFAYWWQADWWAYVMFPEGPMPKFTMPWWWQLIESGVVGCSAGGTVVGVWLCAARMRKPFAERPEATLPGGD